MLKEAELNTIKCPYCGCEYLPGEIYIPKYLLGTPKHVERTFDNKIDTVIGMREDLNESYLCDVCNNYFKVHCTMKFETEKDLNKNLDEEYTTPLYGTDRLTLKED